MEELSEQEPGGWSSGPVQAGGKVGGEVGGEGGIVWYGRVLCAILWIVISSISAEPDGKWYIS